jgi:hypothetical protein
MEIIRIFTSSAIFLEKKIPNIYSDPKFGRKRAALVIPILGEKVPDRRSGLRSSEKELPERRFGAFRHKIHLYRSKYTLWVKR